MDDQAGRFRGLGDFLSLDLVADGLHLDAVKADSAGQREPVLPRQLLREHRDKHRTLDVDRRQRLPRLDVTHRIEPGGQRNGSSGLQHIATRQCGHAADSTAYNASVSFRAVIFDFDGLIIDSETSIFEIWAEIYRDHGGALTMDQWRHALGTHNGFDPYAELLRQTGVQLSRETWMPRVRDEHWRRCEDEPLRPGVLDRLQEANAAGLPAAVASSSSLEWVGPWLTRHGLRQLVRAVCTRNDVARVKPAPDLFLLAAARLGVPRRTASSSRTLPTGSLLRTPPGCGQSPFRAR